MYALNITLKLMIMAYFISEAGTGVQVAGGRGGGGCCRQIYVLCYTPLTVPLPQIPQ